MINHINLEAFRGSITDFTKINYIYQEAAKGLCVYLTKFWKITDKNTFAVVLTIQNHDKNTTPDSATFHYEIKKNDGTIASNTKAKPKASYITMSGETIEGFENRDGFSYYALSLSITTPDSFSNYTMNITFTLDGKEYVLTETGNIYNEYKVYVPSTQPVLTMLKGVVKNAEVKDIEEVE